MEREEIAKRIVDSAIKVHTALGPGLMESAYQKCIEYELKKKGLTVECEVVLPIIYEDITIDAGYPHRHGCSGYGNHRTQDCRKTSAHP
jgi:GxxExxY protein